MYTSEADCSHSRVLYLPDQSGGSQVTRTPAAPHLGSCPRSQRNPPLQAVFRNRSQPKIAPPAALRGSRAALCKCGHSRGRTRRFLRSRRFGTRGHTPYPPPDWSGKYSTRHVYTSCVAPTRGERRRHRKAIKSAAAEASGNYIWQNREIITW